MKKYLFFATALLALASCTSDSFTGDPDLLEANKNAPISFGFDVPTPTRAEGVSAATALSNQFIVWGEKSETNDGAAAADGHLVFKNYLVNYTANTAYTTTSNTKNWEYVGIASTYGDNVTPNSGTDPQTIKYWDYSASSYTFTAVSALPADITAGRVKITKIESVTGEGASAYGKGYTITLAKVDETYPSFDKLFFSDRQVINQGTGTDRTAANAYGGNVKLTFRNTLSKVRVGVYETINGYDITSIKFYITNDAEAKVSTTSAFGGICPNTTVSDFEGTVNVTYYNTGSLVNQPKITVTPKTGLTAKTDLILGTNMSTLSTDSPLGTSSISPTWDTGSGDYTAVFPQIDNAGNLQLKVDYTLYNSITQETINITGATAEVPAQYLQWKPNFRYTYLFKISEDSNGSSGGDVSGLYPITFDAVTVEASDGSQETITTVSEPSITTFGVSGGKYVSGGSDYAAGSDVYATIVASNAIVDPDGKYYIYTASSSNATSFPVTETSVAEVLAETAIGSITGTPVITCTPYTTNVSLVATVPAEDGGTISLTAGKAIKMQALGANTYVVAYRATEGSATATDVAYDSGKTYYSMTKTANGFYPIATPTTDEISAWDSNKSKYTTAPTQPVYVYKIIKVQ